MLGKKIFLPLLLIDVAVPVPIAGKSVLSYWLPKEWQSRIVQGARVMVPIGSRKITGIFLGYKKEKNVSQPEKIKEILDIVDEVPVFSHDLVNLWQWAARYYLKTP